MCRRRHMVLIFFAFYCISTVFCFNASVSKREKFQHSSEQVQNPYSFETSLSRFSIGGVVADVVQEFINVYRKLGAAVNELFSRDYQIEALQSSGQSRDKDRKDLNSAEDSRRQLIPPVAEKGTGSPSSSEDAAKSGEDETSDLSFYHAVIASLSVIIVSELGDKTWFIAAIMAMRHSRLTVFCGAMAALALMTALSAGLGWATQIIPRTLTFYISSALFALFGIKMLYEGYHMSPNEGQEEYEEAHAEVQKQQLLRETNKVADMESGLTTNKNSTFAVMSFVSTLFLEAFMLTFLAEWGDRSQLTTIILAARENVYGVVLGGIAGHALCTGIAVIGGKLVATQISVRTVTLIGGVVFIIFALSAFFIKPE